MTRDLTSLIPKNKHDVEAASAAASAGFRDIEPLLPALLEWVQDRNWPVASVLIPLLQSGGAKTAPVVRSVLAGTDGAWKCELIVSLVGPCPALAVALAEDLRRLVQAPTEDDMREQVHRVAGEALQLMERRELDA